LGEKKLLKNKEKSTKMMKSMTAQEQSDLEKVKLVEGGIDDFMKSVKESRLRHRQRQMCIGGFISTLCVTAIIIGLACFIFSP
jgi:hypothetical protein